MTDFEQSSVSPKIMLTAQTSKRINKMLKTTLSMIGFLPLVLMTDSAMAACKGINCACKASELQFKTPSLQPGENGKYPISLEADEVEAQGEELVSLSGNAEVSQGRQTIVADNLKYYRNDERVVADGNVEMISDKGDYLSSESIDVIVPTQIGTLTNSEFKLARSIRTEDDVDIVAIDSRGSAEKVHLEGEGVVRLEQASYTNCQEGNDDVIIRASSLELDRNAGVGKAKHASVRFMGVPIFYAPYISFPLNDERKTGFLSPGFGSDEDSGNIFEFPWYWNIARNQDATFTPRYYTDRGLQLGAEYRHKSLTSDTYVYAEYLPGDDLYSAELAQETDTEQNTDGDRDLLIVKHTQYFTDNLVGRINYNDVSDIDYFDDLRNGGQQFSTSYVPRDFTLDYSAKYFRIKARANEYQIIDDDISVSRKPYERLPALTFSTTLPKGPYGLNYGMYGSYTNFSTDSTTIDEGTRTALNPYISMPFENIWGYANPSISLHHRNYSLDNVDAVDDNPSFTVPIFSLDTGLYFEKNSSWFGKAALHTLEPRLFYAYAPDEDQTDVPVFDTSQSSLNNFSNIFRANRFFGEDRVGDTNQVTLGITTRFIDNETGNQRLVASIGQLYLFDDLKQFARTDPKIESGLGDLLAEVKTDSGSWTTNTFFQYSHDLNELKTARFSFAYQPKSDKRKNISVGYYYVNGTSRDVDQLAVSARWPISDRWSFSASERYSILDSESLSTTLGLEYNACCWKIRFTGVDRIHDRDINEKRQSFFIELELTSLGRLRTGFE